MQVNNNSLTLSTAIGQTSAVDHKTAEATAGSSSSAGDSVQLSSFAAQLAADPSRIAQLRTAYQAGTSNVSPSQIANSMINEMTAS